MHAACLWAACLTPSTRSVSRGRAARHALQQQQQARVCARQRAAGSSSAGRQPSRAACASSDQSTHCRRACLPPPACLPACVRAHCNTRNTATPQEALVSHLCQAISSCGAAIAPGLPVVHCRLMGEATGKACAFIELRSAEEASNTIALDGLAFGGSHLKVRLPLRAVRGSCCAVECVLRRHAVCNALHCTHRARCCTCRRISAMLCMHLHSRIAQPAPAALLALTAQCLHARVRALAPRADQAAVQVRRRDGAAAGAQRARPDAAAGAAGHCAAHAGGAAAGRRRAAGRGSGAGCGPHRGWRQVLPAQLEHAVHRRPAQRMGRGNGARARAAAVTSCCLLCARQLPAARVRDMHRTAPGRLSALHRNA